MKGCTLELPIRHVVAATRYFVRNWPKRPTGRTCPSAPEISGKADIGRRLLTNHGFMSPRPSPTLAELHMPLPAANPFSTMRASLRWYSSEELEDGVTYGGQSWLRRGSVDSFFSALLLRDGDAAGRRKRSSS